MGTLSTCYGIMRCGGDTCYGIMRCGGDTVHMLWYHEVYMCMVGPLSICYEAVEGLSNYGSFQVAW